MFSCSAVLFLGITAWQSVSLQISQKAHEKNCCVSFGKTGWQRKKKKEVLECVTALLGFGKITESLGCTYWCHNSNRTRNSLGDRAHYSEHVVTHCEDRGTAQQWKRVSGKS